MTESSENSSQTAPNSPNSPSASTSRPSHKYDYFDEYGNIIDASFTGPFLFDGSGNILDLSLNQIYNMNNSIDISSNTTSGIGYEIIDTTALDPSGNVNLHTTFTSTEPEIYDPNINQRFVEYVTIYDNTSDTTSENSIVMNQIIEYASKIKCADFHGKGTIDDYSELFKAAAKIATETKQIQLDVDIDGFNEFGQAADELANLFTTFTLRLQNVNIINDITFLRAVSNALEKISNLSDIFGKFKQTILTTSSIQLPKSSHDTKIILDTVMAEINCAMKYITNFVDVTDETLFDYQLSPQEKNIISKAVDTIDNWNIICQEGVSIAMTTNPDIVSINNTNQLLKTKTNSLKVLVGNLKTKLSGYMTL